MDIKVYGYTGMYLLSILYENTVLCVVAIALKGTSSILASIVDRYHKPSTEAKVEAKLSELSTVCGSQPHKVLDTGQRLNACYCS